MICHVSVMPHACYVCAMWYEPVARAVSAGFHKFSQERERTRAPDHAGSPSYFKLGLKGPRASVAQFSSATSGATLSPNCSAFVRIAEESAARTLMRPMWFRALR